MKNGVCNDMRAPFEIEGTHCVLIVQIISTVDIDWSYEMR